MGTDKLPNVDAVLLSAFDITEGSVLLHVYPALDGGYGQDMLAELMLPDGAHQRSEDWTVFFLARGDLSKPERVR